MKRLTMLVVAATCLSVAAPAMVTPASAVVVRKTVVVKRGYGPRPIVRRGFIGPRHVCRTVRTVTAGRTVVRRTCR